MNTTKSIGIVGTVISGLLLWFGLYKYNEAVEFYKMSGYLNTIWGERTHNYKIMIIVCAIILLISVILLISSLLKNKDNIQTSNNSTQSKLQELEQIYKNGLISDDEYNNKRQELLSKL